MQKQKKMNGQYYMYLMDLTNTQPMQMKTTYPDYLKIKQNISEGCESSRLLCELTIKIKQK